MIRIRLIFLFLTILLIPPLSGQDLAQKKIKIDYQDKPVYLILLDLEINYKLKFVYDKELIDGKRIDDVVTGNWPIEKVLNVLFDGTGIGYRLEDSDTVYLFNTSDKEEVILSSGKEPKRSDLTASGIIKDALTGESLPFATVMIHGTSFGTTTNVDGYFTLLGVPNDTMLLDVSYLGFATKHFRLDPDLDVSNLVIGLENAGVRLDEVVVTAAEEKQAANASSGISRISMAPSMMAKLPSYGEQDIFRSLQLLPGVSGSNESSSGLYVRGGTPDQNLILFDGFTVYHVDHLFGFFSAFNSNAIKDVQLYKGGFDAKYGGRISSVVELTGKDGNSEQFNAGAGVSLLAANAFVESPFAKGKGTFLIAGRRSFQSKFYRNLFNAYTGSSQSDLPQDRQGGPGGFGFGQQTVQPNTYFYDLNAKLTYKPGTKDVLSLSFYNGQDDLDNSRNSDQNSFGRPFGGSANLAFNQQNTDLTNWGNWGTSFKWSRKWNEAFYSKYQMSYSNYYSERDRSSSTTVTRDDSTFTNINGNYEYNDLKDYHFKLENEWQIDKWNWMEFGMEGSYNDIRYQYTQNDTSTILDRLNKGWTYAVYAQDRLTLGERAIVKAGLRGNYYTVTQKWYLEPRVSLTYLVNDQLKLKAAFGNYHQFATRIIREDIQQGSRDFWLLADETKVPISQAYHYILGASYENTNWLFDMEAYYKPMTGLSEYSTRFVPSGFGPDRSLNYEEFFYTGDGIAKGIEWLVQKKYGAWNGWIGYTLGSVKYQFDQFGDDPYPANQDQTHEFKIVSTYRIGRLTLGGTFIYATGKPYTAPVGFYEVRLLNGSTGDFFEVSGKNAFRYPDYHRLDISATMDFRIGQSKANAGLTLFNLYNHKNVWYKEYEVIEGSLYETNVSLLGFTPSLFFNWTLH